MALADLCRELTGLPAMVMPVLSASDRQHGLRFFIRASSTSIVLTLTSSFLFSSVRCLLGTY